jgi:hypothetical protein
VDFAQALTKCLFLHLRQNQSYVFLWYYKPQKMSQAFTIWLIFSVWIALMPIIFNVIVFTLVIESDTDISTILAQGDFVIVSVPIG